MRFRDRLRWQEYKLEADARSRKTDEGIERLGKDLTGKLKEAAESARPALADSQKQMEEDRKQIAGIIESLRNLLASGQRIEEAGVVVAEDLKNAHERADAVEGTAGEAADEAARSAPPE